MNGASRVGEVGASVKAVQSAVGKYCIELFGSHIDRPLTLSDSPTCSTRGIAMGLGVGVRR